LIERLRAALADGQLEVVENSANAILPRARNLGGAEPVTPHHDDGDTLLDNGLVHARTNARGVLLELASPKTRVPIAQANLVTGLGRSPSEMAIELHRSEPFLRVGLDVNWRKLWGRVRLENWFALSDARIRYGMGGRVAALEDDRAGCAIFAAPGTTWEMRALARGGVHLRADLLRKRGPAQLAWAFAPFEPGISMGALERAWEQFAYPPRVRLFTSEDPGVLVVETKPAEDSDDVVVRVRECDGVERSLRLRCGARMREVEGDAKIEDESIVANIPGFGERTFRVRF
jgi:hypothetical protein